MADIKLFDIHAGVREIPGGTVTLEREIQNVIENNMPTFFGVTFLESEYRVDGGRMDSIGIDENYCPVIFEYKRSLNENVINQGLFYLDWLLNHKDSFKVLVIEKLGMGIAKKIDWSKPRVICVAGDFTKYDVSAINQMIRNITLVRYRKFGDKLVMFEHVNENVADPIAPETDSAGTAHRGGHDKTFTELYDAAPESLRTLYDSIRDFALSLGDDVSENVLKLYTAFKLIKNFMCVELQTTRLRVFLKLDLETSSMEFEDGFSRDVSGIGHWGTGNVELTIADTADFVKAQPFIERAYREA